MTMPNITAAICTYNRYDTLPKAVVSLTHQSLPDDQFEIIIVDNSPDHERSREISEDWARFVDPYLQQRSSLALCLALVDSNVPPQESDSQLQNRVPRHQ